ncbi:hypothetical protein C8J56DRAFT_888535 [Mycena floridula]|nr:hypothetical protein C8J56DRAFT_888535 [Mycena floridula]
MRVTTRVNEKRCHELQQESELNEEENEERKQANMISMTVTRGSNDEGVGEDEGKIESLNRSQTHGHVVFERYTSTTSLQRIISIVEEPKDVRNPDMGLRDREKLKGDCRQTIEGDETRDRTKKEGEWATKTDDEASATRGRDDDGKSGSEDEKESVNRRERTWSNAECEKQTTMKRKTEDGAPTLPILPNPPSVQMPTSSTISVPSWLDSPQLQKRDQNKERQENEQHEDRWKKRKDPTSRNKGRRKDNKLTQDPTAGLRFSPSPGKGEISRPRFERHKVKWLVSAAATARREFARDRAVATRGGRGRLMIRDRRDQEALIVDKERTSRHGAVIYRQCYRITTSIPAEKLLPQGWLDELVVVVSPRTAMFAIVVFGYTSRSEPLDQRGKWPEKSDIPRTPA